MHSTPGADALRRFLEGPPRRTQAAVARDVGVTQQTISDWATGRSRPVQFYVAKLAKIAGIPAEAWFTRRERTSIDRATRTGTEG